MTIGFWDKKSYSFLTRDIIRKPIILKRDLKKKEKKKSKNNIDKICMNKGRNN